MVQLGAAVNYRNPMDEQPEPFQARAIRDAVREFVDAINESSKQLVTASERFAVESFRATERARSQSERSAATSANMARQAEHAAEETRTAISGLQSAVDDAREQVRGEAQITLDKIASQVVEINRTGTQIKQDLQQRIDEMVARLEAGTAAQNETMATVRAASERIEASVNAVESAVASARQAAQEARQAAEQSRQSMGNVSEALASAQEAAESSRESASLAEQAGKRSDFAAEASMLLERLETDYSLLTRLVQELHSRISSLSSVSVAPPAPSYLPEMEEAPEETPEMGERSFEESTPYDALGYTESDAAEETPAQPPMTSDFAYQQIDASGSYGLPAEPPVDLGVASPPEHEAPWPQQAPEAMELEPTPPVAMPSTPSVSIFGRVQMKISPVPDFDKLLNMDSALARVADVRNVTLADYAGEEVIFRVELDKPVSVLEFARQLSETAGVSTEVTEASESTLSIHIG